MANLFEVEPHSDDQYWMAIALQQAQMAANLGEVPVGAVVVVKGKLVAVAYNSSIQSHDPTAHAEVNVIRKACQALENYRLINACLYVTLEPCTMCLGALIHSRVTRVVFGASEPKAGAIVSAAKTDCQSMNHSLSWTQGILAANSKTMVQSFFKQQRYQAAGFKKLCQSLKAKAIKLTTAESCTGGLIASRLTSESGSSAWFDQGWVTYSADAKHSHLGVPKTLLQDTMVSADVARAMAIGALQASMAHMSISVTGIAGPNGGVAATPVGCCWFGFAWQGCLDSEMVSQAVLAFDAVAGESIIIESSNCVVRCDFVGNRQQIREAAVIFALGVISHIIEPFKKNSKRL